MNATVPISTNVEGRFSLTGSNPARAGRPGQIGDEVDRAGGQHDAGGPASSRARASARRGSSSMRATRSRARRPPARPGPGAIARGFSLAVKTTPSQSPSRRSNIARRPCPRVPRRPPPAGVRRGTPAATRRAPPPPPRCGRRRARARRRRRRAPRSARARGRRGGRAHRRRLQRAGRPAPPRRRREVAPLKGAARRELEGADDRIGGAGRARPPRPALGGDADSAPASGCRSGPSTSVAPGVRRRASRARSRRSSSPASACARGRCSSARRPARR